MTSLKLKCNGFSGYQIAVTGHVDAHAYSLVVDLSVVAGQAGSKALTLPKDQEVLGADLGPGSSGQASTYVGASGSAHYSATAAKYSPTAKADVGNIQLKLTHIGFLPGSGGDKQFTTLSGSLACQYTL